MAAELCEVVPIVSARLVFDGFDTFKVDNVELSVSHDCSRLSLVGLSKAAEPVGELIGTVDFPNHPPNIGCNLY